MQKKHTLIPFSALIIAAFFGLNSSTLTLAASPSPTPSISPSPASDEQVTENIKKRLQETLEETDPSISSYKSFVGQVQDVIKNTLIITDKDGKKNVVIKDDTNIVRSPGNAKINADSIRIDDYVIAIGSLKESEELEAVRIIVSADSLTTSNKSAGLAKITKISKSNLTVTPLSGGETKILAISSKTTLKTNLGESLDLTDLTIGDSIVYTYTTSKDTLTATAVMRIGFADSSPTPTPTDAE